MTALRRLLTATSFAVLAAGTTPLAAQPVRVVADSVGPLPTYLPLHELRQLWPGAQDTVYYDHETVFPAVLFRVGTVEALAVQARMDYDAFAPLPLRLDCAADFWLVTGDDAVIGEFLPLRTPWSQILADYGPATVSTETTHVRVRFDYMLDWLFDLDTELLPRVVEHGLDGIPPDARIWRVHLPLSFDMAPDCASDLS